MDYDSDCQKGVTVGSPCSLQLSFSSPLSLDKDLSACMALLRNSLVKKITESPFNFADAGMLKDACEKEQEGTSHAQDQAPQVGSDSVVSFSAAPLPPSTGKEKNETHPPIRAVRGLTPPNQEAEWENSPPSESVFDPEFELLLARNRMTKKQLQEEVLSWTKKAAQQEDTVKALRQHIASQIRTIVSEQEEKRRLLSQCLHFAALIRLLPSGTVDEDMISTSPFTNATYAAAMYKHVSIEDRKARQRDDIREEMERNGESSGEDTDVSGTDDERDEENTLNVQSSSPEKKNSNEEYEGNRTPSPVKQSAEHSLMGGEGIFIEEAIEESNKQDQQHQLLQLQ